MLGLARQTALSIATGVGAMYGSARAIGPRHNTAGIRRVAWLRFAMWPRLGLEFELAAGIVRTAISAAWSGVGQRAAVGAIRTFPNFSLDRHLDKYERSQTPDDATRIPALTSDEFGRV